MRYAGYTRVGDGPDVAGYGPAAQAEGIARFVAARGGELVGIYEDQSSGRRADLRTAFGRLIADAAADAFDAVVVHKHDRFARDRRDALVYKALLKQRGIPVLSVLEPTDPDSPGGMLVEGMLEVVAEFYSLNLAQEVRKGLSRRAALGFHVGAAPFGYRLAHGMLLPTDELTVAREVLETYLSGTVSDHDLVRSLGARGLRRRRADGALVPLTRDTVRSILTSPVYAGLVGSRGAVVAGRHPAIISPAQHEAILTQRGRFFRASRANRRSPRAYPFSSVLRCGRCGGPMWGSASLRGRHEHMTYRCAWRHQGRTACDQPAIPSSLIDRAALAAMERMIIPRSLAEAALARTDQHTQRERARAELTAVDQRLRRARTLFLEGLLEPDAWRAEEERARREERRLRIPNVQAGRPGARLAPATVRTIAALFHRAEGAGRKALARLVLAKMEADGRTARVIAATSLGEWLIAATP